MGALQVLWQMGAMALFLVLSELPENRVEIIAAFTAGLRIESAIYLPAFAFNMANAVIVGNLLGGKKQEEAYRSGLITALIGVSVVVAPRGHRDRQRPLDHVPSLHQSRSWRECTRYIYIAMISEPFMAWGIILGGGLSGAGDTQERHDQGGREHLARPHPPGLPSCRGPRLWGGLGLVVHEYLPVRPILPPLQEILPEEVAHPVGKLEVCRGGSLEERFGSTCRSGRCAVH